MEKTITQERNLFSKGIVELKLISDRIAEGKGESAGIFSNTYQILYIRKRFNTIIFLIWDEIVFTAGPISRISGRSTPTV